MTTTHRYFGNSFRATSTTTDTRHGARPVYEIDGPHGKPACVRPFLTSVAGCRRYVRDALDREIDRASGR